jgi:membrane-associated phospholipid phosphatase
MSLCSVAVAQFLVSAPVLLGQDRGVPQHPEVQAAGSALPDAPRPQQEDTVTLRGTPLRVLRDQGHIWTSPLRVKVHDLVWLAPLAVATGAAIATDHRAMTSVVSHDSSFNNANTNASNVLAGGIIALPVAVYGAGYLKDNAHAREAGLLGGESLLDGLVVEQGVKLIFWRERPNVDGGHGKFFQTGVGVDSSFPSSHSVLAWSSAAVLAAEYPSPWSQVGIYSLATGVSVTRVLGQQHFPSDVLVGSALGWLVGHYVYRAHHHHADRDHGYRERGSRFH